MSPGLYIPALHVTGAKNTSPVRPRSELFHRASSLLLSSKWGNWDICQEATGRRREKRRDKEEQNGEMREALNPKSSLCAKTHALSVHALIQLQLIWAFSSLNWRKIKLKSFYYNIPSIVSPDSLFCLSWEGVSFYKDGTFWKTSHLICLAQTDRLTLAPSIKSCTVSTSESC